MPQREHLVEVAPRLRSSLFELLEASGYASNPTQERKILDEIPS